LSDDRGVVFNIQRFSIQDGPGIRTTVFFKGCPLSCQWCSNPEGKKSKPQIILRRDRCIGCRMCVEACQQDAIRLEIEGEKCWPFINWGVCTQCLDCAKVCPSRAISTVGEEMPLKEVITHASADIAFFLNSGGGVTASGGEPLSQWRVVRRIFKRLQAKGIRTALDTCGYAPWEALKDILPYTNLVLYDLKHMDGETHKQLTGKDNSLILANAEGTAKRVETWFRMPLIPGYNDCEKNIKELAKFAVSLGVNKISLLVFHEFGKNKYEQIGEEYLPIIPKPSGNEWIEIVHEIIGSYNLVVTVNS